MKSKFEKELRKKAYDSVPDKWDEISKRTEDIKPSGSINSPVRFRPGSAIAAAAAVILIIGIGFAVRGINKNAPVKTEGVNAVQSIEAYDSAGQDETATAEANEETVVFSYTDENGKTRTTIASSVEKANGKKVVTYTDSQGKKQTAVIEEQTSGTDTQVTHAFTESSVISAGAASSGTKKEEAAETTTNVERATVRNWNDRSLPGQYSAVTVDGREYVYPFSSAESRSAKRSGTKYLSGLTITGYEPDGKKHTATADIFTLNGFDKKLAIGVKLNGDSNIYPYINVHYTPATLGEFLNATDYDNTISYGNITLYRSGVFPVNSQNKSDIKKYLLSDKNAKISINSEPEGEYVELSVSLEELGMQNKSFRVYENGYVRTNLIGYGFVFYAGKENVADFLKNSYNITFDQIREVKGTRAPAVNGTTSSDDTELTSKPHFVNE